MFLPPLLLPFSSGRALRCGAAARRISRAQVRDSVFAVLVEQGRVEAELGSSAHVRSSSPQKSPASRTLELKKPVCPPFVVILSRDPLMMKSISFTGSPSRTMQLPSVYNMGLRRSHMASKS
ncbi:hypothetical protein EJB05_25104 [Eragrostis curvula]|uniref:Uncharacterized protein n=1 Tax=Eragrostis curvula TaxID=38414 RepID=A0A5J9VCX9_9POAL|nr:hypothetical protein EJB05_25104 [Eragrostis curvula]